MCDMRTAVSYAQRISLSATACTPPSTSRSLVRLRPLFAALVLGSHRPSSPHHVVRLRSVVYPYCARLRSRGTYTTTARAGDLVSPGSSCTRRRCPGRCPRAHRAPVLELAVRAAAGAGTPNTARARARRPRCRREPPDAAVGA